MAKIFISYKRSDRDRVFPLKRQIEEATGETCWIDLDGIESDAQFVNVIIKAINECEVFLFMYSKLHAEIRDFDKDWTMREVNFAQKKKKRIVFVNIDKTPLSDQFEMLFGLKQQVDATSPKAMEHLIRDLRKWLKIENVKPLGPTPPVPPTPPVVTPKKPFALRSQANIIIQCAMMAFCLFAIIACVWFGVIKSDKSIASSWGTLPWRSPQYIVALFRNTIPLLIVALFSSCLSLVHSPWWLIGFWMTVPFAIWNFFAHQYAFVFMCWPSSSPKVMSVVYVLMGLAMTLPYIVAYFNSRKARLSSSSKRSA